MKVISESKMNFGQFAEENLFHIEKSKIYKDLGSGIIFLEAKESCPNVANRYESEEKEQKFEEYYSSIVDKFTDSLQVYLAVILNKFQDTEEVGDKLRTVNDMKDIKLKFVLVLKYAEDIEWLAGPLAELKARLLQIRKIWGIEIAVLNEELARKYRIIC